MAGDLLHEENFIYSIHDIHRIVWNIQAATERNIVQLKPGKSNLETLNLSDITAKTRLIHKILTSTENYVDDTAGSIDQLQQNIYTNLDQILMKIEDKSAVDFCFPIRLAKNEFLTLIFNTKGVLYIFDAYYGKRHDSHCDAILKTARDVFHARFPDRKISATFFSFGLTNLYLSGMVAAYVATTIEPTNASLQSTAKTIKKDVRELVKNADHQQVLYQLHSEAIRTNKRESDKKRSLFIKRQAEKRRNQNNQNNIEKQVEGSSPCDPLPNLNNQIVQLGLQGREELAQLIQNFQKTNNWLGDLFYVLVQNNQILLQARIYIIPDVALQQLERYFQVKQTNDSYEVCGLTPEFINDITLSNENVQPQAQMQAPMCNPTPNQQSSYYAQPHQQGSTFFQTPVYPANYNQLLPGTRSHLPINAGYPLQTTNYQAAQYASYYPPFSSARPQQPYSGSLFQTPTSRPVNQQYVPSEPTQNPPDRSPQSH